MKYIVDGNKIGNTVNIIINGLSMTKTFSTSNEALKVYRQLLYAKTHPNEYSITHLQNLLIDRVLTPVNTILSQDEKTKEYFYKKYDTPVPYRLALAMIDNEANQLPNTALENFWLHLLANENLTVQKILFDIIADNHFIITENGYCIGYTVSSGSQNFNYDKSLIDFISSQFGRIKQWKKSPANYSVLRDSKKELFLIETKNLSLDADNNKEHIGTLDKLYEGLYNSKINIALGRPVSVDRTTCETETTKFCKNSFRVGSLEYAMNKKSFSDSALLVVFNPQHVTGLPSYEGAKIRLCEYFPLAILENSNSDVTAINLPYTENDYRQYEEVGLGLAINELESKMVDHADKFTFNDNIRLLAMTSRWNELIANK